MEMMQHIESINVRRSAKKETWETKFSNFFFAKNLFASVFKSSIFQSH